METWILLAVAWVCLVLVADYCLTGMHDAKMDRIAGQLITYGALLFLGIGIFRKVLRT